MSTPNYQAIPFEIGDQEDDYPPQKGEVRIHNHGLEIYLEGYGECYASEGYGTPVYLEVEEGNAQLYVWEDINNGEPQRFDLSRAKESNRLPEEE